MSDFQWPDDRPLTEREAESYLKHPERWAPPRPKNGAVVSLQTRAPLEAKQEPLRWLDMSGWDAAPVPERQWAIRDRVPLNQAGLFSGEGGTGKSIIELMKDVAHVTGKDWLGSMPEPGPAIYLGAEDDETEIHIRLAAIASHYGVSFEQLTQGGLYVMCLLGQDATLCAANGRTGKVETTELYRRLYEAAGDIKPKNISIDTLSRAFAGNEIDRVQVFAILVAKPFRPSKPGAWSSASNGTTLQNTAVGSIWPSPNSAS